MASLGGALFWSSSNTEHGRVIKSHTCVLKWVENITGMKPSNWLFKYFFVNRKTMYLINFGWLANYKTYGD